MNEESARIYVRHLRYFYQELILFIFMLILAFSAFFSVKIDVFLVLLGWGSALVWRGKYFKIFEPMKKKWNKYSLKWKERK